MEEIIARTTYKNKNLVIYKDQNQICFGKLENNQIITDIPKIKSINNITEEVPYVHEETFKTR